jgi:plastocyanin
MRRVIVLLAGVALTAAACGNNANEATQSEAPSTGPQTRTVLVDSKTPAFNGAFLSYFPASVQVRPGDTVVFKEMWTGEPHSVTAGTLVEKCLTAAKAAGEPTEGGAPPADCATLPTMLPEGPGDAHQNAAQPCFLDTGAPPTDKENKPCAKAATQPAFNGKQTYYNSGFLPEGKSFTVKIDDSTAPGAYRYYCNLHGPEMQGTINVAAKGTTIPTQSAVDQTAAAELKSTVDKVTGPYQGTKAGQSPIKGNLAGLGVQEAQNAGINEFIPNSITAKVGQKVSWTIFGPHTITFGSTITPGGFIVVSPDGSVHLNPQAMGPAGGPGAPSPPSGPPPSGPPSVVKTFDGGKYDGTGVKSTGFVGSFPPALLGWTLTFTKAGTYPYVCLIHPGMTGNVQVTA